MREIIVTEDIALRLEVLSQLFPTVASSLHPTKSPIKRLSMNEITTYRWSFLEDVIGYKSMGINTMGVWLPKLLEFGEERGIELIHDLQIDVSSVSWAGGFTGVNGHTYIDSIDDAFEALQIAGKLKAKNLLLVSGPRAGHTMNHARNIFIDAIDELTYLAGELNVNLAVQPMSPALAHEWTFLTRLDDALHIIEECSHPAVKLAFDVYHLWKTPNLLKRIQEIASRTAIVQLSDSTLSPNSNYERLLPGKGDIPLTEIIQAFQEAGYAGEFEINIWSEELWQTDYKTLLQNCKQQYASQCHPQPVDSSIK